MQARFKPCTSKIQEVGLTNRTTIIYSRFYVFSFHIQMIEETNIENRVHKTMVLSAWIVHVISKTVCTKTMASNPWFCACHKNKKGYKNPNRAYVKGGSICNITIAITINIFSFFLLFFLFIVFSYIDIFLSSIIPRTCSPVQGPDGRSSSTRTRESSR